MSVGAAGYTAVETVGIMPGCTVTPGNADRQRCVEKVERGRAHSSPATSSPGSEEHDQRDLVRDAIWRAEIGHRQPAGPGEGDRTAHDEDRSGDDEREAREAADAVLKVVRAFGAVGLRAAVQVRIVSRRDRNSWCVTAGSSCHRGTHRRSPSSRHRTTRSRRLPPPSAARRAHPCRCAPSPGTSS